MPNNKQNRQKMSRLTQNLQASYDQPTNQPRAHARNRDFAKTQATKPENCEINAQTTALVFQCKVLTQQRITPEKPHNPHQKNRLLKSPANSGKSADYSPPSRGYKTPPPKKPSRPANTGKPAPISSNKSSATKSASNWRKTQVRTQTMREKMLP